jgi:hypothetical protein
MLPMMPSGSEEAPAEPKVPAPMKKPPTRAEAVRASLARKTRRASLRKQRDAQKG